MVAKSWIWLSDLTFTFHFHALEKEMATHSSLLAWRIPGTGEPGGLRSVGSHRVRHDWSNLAAAAAALRLSLERPPTWKPLIYEHFSMFSKFVLKYVSCPYGVKQNSNNKPKIWWLYKLLEQNSFIISSILWCHKPKKILFPCNIWDLKSLHG